MGGQISRYALAYMEKKYAVTQLPEWQHNCRLWVSVDSPHLGANIPIGLQSLLNQVANSGNVEAQDFVNKQLSSAAAKQQLIEQFNGWNGSQLKTDYFDGRASAQGYPASHGHPFFVQYYNDLYNNGLPDSHGYPLNLRKIALINGSLDGSKSFYNPFTQQEDNYIGNKAMGLNIRAFQTICFVFCFDVHIGSLEAYNLPDYNDYGKISRFKKAFNDHSKYATNINPRGNMDNVPGGWYPSFDDVASPIDGTDPFLPGGSFWNFEFTMDNVIYAISDFFGSADLNVYKNEHVNSFIPTVSSLGFKNPNFNWNQELDRVLTCTSGEIPFDNYYGPKQNEQHTSFTEKSITWLLEELDGDSVYPVPTVYLDGGDLSGPSTICENQTSTYSFGPCESTPVLSWEVSNNLIKTSYDDFSVTVRPKNPISNGTGYIRAIFENYPLQKEFWVGAPEVPAGSDITTSDTSVYMNTTSFFWAPDLAPGIKYEWEISYNSNCQNDPNAIMPLFSGYGSNYEITISDFMSVAWGDCSGMYSVVCYAVNDCEEKSPIGVQMVEVFDYSSDEPCNNLWLDIVPNPVEDDTATASILAPPPCPPIGGDDDPFNYKNVQAILYDMQGNIRISQTFDGLQFTLRGFSALEQGLYVLNVVTQKGKQGEEIIIVE